MQRVGNKHPPYLGQPFSSPPPFQPHAAKRGVGFTGLRGKHQLSAVLSRG